MLILVTGATGKVGQAFLGKLFATDRFADARVRALCHNRTIPEHARLEVVCGSMSDPDAEERQSPGVPYNHKIKPFSYSLQTEQTREEL